jgi:hypothetical protein
MGESEESIDIACHKYLRAVHGFETINHRISQQCCLRVHNILKNKLDALDSYLLPVQSRRRRRVTNDMMLETQNKPVLPRLRNEMM